MCVLFHLYIFVCIFCSAGFSSFPVFASPPPPTPSLYLFTSINHHISLLTSLRVLSQYFILYTHFFFILPLLYLSHLLFLFLSLSLGVSHFAHLRPLIFPLPEYLPLFSGLGRVSFPASLAQDKRSFPTSHCSRPSIGVEVLWLSLSLPLSLSLTLSLRTRKTRRRDLSGSSVSCWPRFKSLRICVIVCCCNVRDFYVFFFVSLLRSEGFKFHLVCWFYFGGDLFS